MAKASKKTSTSLDVYAPEEPKIDWLHQDVDIERRGTKITLPDDPGPMPIDDAIEALKRKQADENMVMDIHEIIKCFPLEGAVAFVEAMRIKYGWASPTPKPGFFGPEPPDMLTVQVGVNDYIQVPWGNFKIPGIENPVGLDTVRDDGELNLVIYGSAKKKEQGVLLELARMTRQILKERSIYLGKAINLRTDEDGDLDMRRPPTFIDLRNVAKDELVMNDDVAEQILTNISAPILHTDQVRRAGIPLKRGVLLEGRYGVGKTLTTQITAKTCVENGWTFIMVDRPSSLAKALMFAQRYQPAVVFCEDIDRSTEERDDAANDLLNTIDGILSKTAEVMVVLTTNFVDKINPAMLRPGRLDAVITIAPPDEGAVKKLITIYSRGLLADGETLDKVAGILAGNIPAVIREVVERSKLSMIAHGNERMKEEDLIVAANGMQNHLLLLAEKPKERSVGDQLAENFSVLVQSAMFGQAFEGADPETMQRIERKLQMGIRDLMSKTQDAQRASRNTAGRVESMRELVDEIHSAVA